MPHSGLSLIGDSIRCSCKGYNLDKLIQPQILTILANQDLHGYSIFQELENVCLFSDGRIDSTGVYRSLRMLEDRNMIHYEWMLDESGPARKVYRITDTGIQCLNTWIHTLACYKDSIERVMENAIHAIDRRNQDESA